METELFLNSVLCSDGSYCLFASNSKANKITQKFFDNTTDLLATAYRLDSEGWDTYFALSTFITSESRTSSNVHKLKSFFVDLDCGPSKDYEPLSFDTFSRFFGVEQTPIPRAKGSPKSAVMDALLGSRESRFIDIIKKTNAGSGCEQLSLIMTDQENTSEPMWRAGLSIARFCSDGDKAARKLSKKHPNYSEEETVKKYGPV